MFSLIAQLQEAAIQHADHVQISNQALEVGSWMLKGGFSPTADQLATVLNVVPQQVIKSVEWRNNKKNKINMPFQLGDKPIDNNPLYRLMVGLTFLDKNKVGGLSKLSQFTGMPPEQIMEIVSQNEDLIKQHIPRFQMYWLKEREPMDIAAKNLPKEEKLKRLKAALDDWKKIYAADSSKKITGEMLAGMNKGFIGMSERDIYRALKDNPEFHKYRYMMVHPDMDSPTDEDKERAYMMKLYGKKKKN